MHSGEHARISCSQIIARILSDAGWLGEDLPALHGLTLRLLFIELLPTLVVLSVRFQVMDQQQRDIVWLYGLKKKRRKCERQNFVGRGMEERESRRIYQFGVLFSPLFSAIRKCRHSESTATQKVSPILFTDLMKGIKMSSSLNDVIHGKHYSTVFSHSYQLLSLLVYF